MVVTKQAQLETGLFRKIRDVMRWDVVDEEEFGERRARRIALRCQVFLAADQGLTGEAHLLDTSTTGCRLTSSVAVRLGQELRISLLLNDHPWPLQIDKAVVCWIKGQEFGVKFLAIRPSVQERLRCALMKQKRLIRLTA